MAALPLSLLPLLACPAEDGAGTSATEGAQTTGDAGDASLSSGDEPTTGTTVPESTMTDTTSADSTTTGTSTDAATTSTTTEGDTSTATGTTDDTTAGDTTTTTDATSTGEGTTTGLACGNGDTDEDEECDPTDPELVEVAVCSDACTWKGVVVFITDAVFLGDLGGVEGADQKCRDAAAQAKLQSPEKYTAWLSVGDDTAASRIPMVDDPYYLLSGDAIALDHSALLSGKLLHAIDMTEKKVFLESSRRVWTNTTSAGETASQGDDCQSFTSAGDSDLAPIGLSNETDTAWTYTAEPDELLRPCDKPLRLYCFSGDF